MLIFPMIWVNLFCSFHAKFIFSRLKHKIIKKIFFKNTFLKKWSKIWLKYGQQRQIAHVCIIKWYRNWVFDYNLKILLARTFCVIINIFWSHSWPIILTFGFFKKSWETDFIAFHYELNHFDADNQNRFCKLKP